MPRRIGLVLVCLSVLTACSFSLEQILLIPTATPTFTPSPFLSPTITLTLTPTQPTPTYTLTPTLIGAKTATPTATLAPSETPGPSPTAPPLGTATATFQMDGLTAIYVSNSEFFTRRECGPADVRFTVQVADPGRAAFVVLFVRFKSTRTGNTGEWTSITMENLGAGSFSHTLVADEMKGLSSFENPWVQYQLVPADKNSKPLGRTQIFDEMLALKSCDLSPSPTSTP